MDQLDEDALLGCTAASGGPGTSTSLDLAITVAALAALLVLAAVRLRLPLLVQAQTLIAKTVLAGSVALVAWTSLVLPLLPPAMVTGAVFEHTTLALTAVLSVAFAAASWTSR